MTIAMEYPGVFERVRETRLLPFIRWPDADWKAVRVMLAGFD
jgi:hypothetical protein